MVPNKHGGKRITLKCSRCQQAVTATVPKNFSTGSIRVLVGHSDRRISVRIMEILTSAGIGSQICCNGREVLGCLNAMRPEVALFDVALPGIFTFQVLDTLRKTADLKGIKVLLISSVYNSTAYKRPPSSLYGADDYLDETCLADQLVSKIRSLVDVSVEMSADRRTDHSGATEIKSIIPRICPNGKHGDASSAGVVERARNLARTIVSDIARDNREKAEASIRAGNFFRSFDEEIREGNRLFEQQIDPEVRLQEDYLHQAFLSFLELHRRELKQKQG